MLGKKKIQLFVTALITMIFLAACGNSEDNGSSNGESGADSQETVTLSLASFVPTTHIWSEYVEQKLIERVEELTDGKVKIEHYPGGQMGGGPELFDFTADGTVDIAFVVPAYNPTEMSLSENLTSMPGLYRDSIEGSHAYYNLSQESPILEEDYLNHGIRPIYTLAAPPYDLYTGGKEIKVPSDIAGMQIRASGGVKTEALEFVGANPVTLPVGDLFSALDRGVVEGVHTYHPDLPGYGIVEQIKYGTSGLGLGGSVFGLAMNEDVYQSLSEEAKEAFKTASLEIHEDFPTRYQEYWVDLVDTLTEAGITLHEPTDSERAEWEALFEEFAQKHMEKLDSDEFNNLYDSFNEKLEEVR